MKSESNKNQKTALLLRRKILEKQGYQLVGGHSAIKLCHYCKNTLRGKIPCYKNTFYGIKSWQCIQATVTLDICNLKCQWCWRDIDYNPKHIKFTDSPKDIVKGLIEKQKQALTGFFGFKEVDKKRLKESTKPKHVALSLTGDACMYPKLPELIDEIHKNDMTSFLVTNGTFTPMLKKLIKHQPIQLYITLPAPDEETFEKLCKPSSKNQWKNILNSLKLLKHFKRSVIRFTLAKEMNFKDPKKYSDIINNVECDFIEIKSAMPIGGAMYRMTPEQVPTQEELKTFAKKIQKLTKFKIIDKQEESRVILMSKEDNNKRFLKIDYVVGRN